MRTTKSLALFWSPALRLPEQKLLLPLQSQIWKTKMMLRFLYYLDWVCLICLWCSLTTFQLVSQKYIISLFWDPDLKRQSSVQCSPNYVKINTVVEYSLHRKIPIFDLSLHAVIWNKENQKLSSTFCELFFPWIAWHVRSNLKLDLEIASSKPKTGIWKKKIPLWRRYLLICNQLLCFALYLSKIAPCCNW